MPLTVLPGRSVIRIAVNMLLDAVLAAASVPLSRWLAAPGAAALDPLWLLPLGAAALLMAGVPFGLSRQHWRFVSAGDLLGTGAASLLTAAILAVVAGIAARAVRQSRLAADPGPVTHRPALRPPPGLWTAAHPTSSRPRRTAPCCWSARRKTPTCSCALPQPTGTAPSG